MFILFVFVISCALKNHPLAVEGSVKRTRGRRTESEKKKASEESGTTAAPADDRLTGRLRLRLHRRMSLQESGLSVKNFQVDNKYNAAIDRFFKKKIASSWQRCVCHLICK